MRNLNEILNVINKKITEKPLVIYGMSMRAVNAYVELLNRAEAEGEKLDIIAFCDSKQFETTEKKFCGKAIWSLDELQSNVGNVNVFISTNTRAYQYEIVQKLNEMGFGCEDIFYYSRIFDIDENEAKQYILENKEQFNRVYCGLADDYSKEIYECIVRYYIESNKAYVKKAYQITAESGGGTIL